jgi:hypothetical protein
MNFIGEIIFHELKVNITENITGKAIKIRKYIIYGDTNKYGINFFFMWLSLLF